MLFVQFLFLLLLSCTVHFSAITMQIFHLWDQCRFAACAGNIGICLLRSTAKPLCYNLQKFLPNRHKRQTVTIYGYTSLFYFSVSNFTAFADPVSIIPAFGTGEFLTCCTGKPTAIPVAALLHLALRCLYSPWHTSLPLC